MDPDNTVDTYYTCLLVKMYMNIVRTIILMFIILMMVALNLVYFKVINCCGPYQIDGVINHIKATY